MAGASSASSSKMPSSSSTTPKSKGKLSLRAGGAAPSSSKLAPAPKRARFQDAGDDDDDDREESDAADFEDEDEDDDEEAIGAARAAAGRSEKTAKRKRRALDPSAFGSALDDFLGMGDDEPSTEVAAGDVDDGEAAPTEPAPSRKRKAGGSGAGGQAPIFALAPSVRSRISSSTLSAKAGRLATEERRTRMDRFRVRDVIGGWGKPGELPSDQALADGSDAEEDAVDGGAGDFSSKLHERALRKVAQRGVVKLFNAIRAAQSTSLPEDDDGAAATKKSKDSSSSAAVDAKAGDVTSRNNALGGKGRQLNDLSKANFLDLLKSGKRAKAA